MITSFLADINEALIILKRLANCIAVCERASGSLGVAIKSLLEEAKTLLSSNLEKEFVLAGVKAFFHYFNTDKLTKDELPIMIVAYALDIRHSMNYLTGYRCGLAIRGPTHLAQRTGFLNQVLKTQLSDEFKQFERKSKSFSCDFEETESASNWWSEQRGLTVLRTLGLRLANLKSSSANIERIFSILKIIQGPVRTRFSIDTLQHLVRVKVSMLDSNDIEMYGILEKDKLVTDDALPLIIMKLDNDLVSL